MHSATRQRPLRIMCCTKLKKQMITQAVGSSFSKIVQLGIDKWKSRASGAICARMCKVASTALGSTTILPGVLKLDPGPIACTRRYEICATLEKCFLSFQKDPPSPSNTNITLVKFQGGASSQQAISMLRDGSFVKPYGRWWGEGTSGYL